MAKRVQRALTPPQLGSKQEVIAGSSSMRLRRRLDDAEELTRVGELSRAHHLLQDVGTTPKHLGTRMLNIKLGLARAQGLHHGFILRVDEAGEYLVLRSSTLSIGNLRKRCSDLQILANIAGRHARIRRSMSFHGGMQDQILREEGDVFINGEKVEQANLQSGDMVRLGSRLEFLYQMPSRRSLTAMLTLQHGFQIEGMEKILLLKDPGKDGRILIGRSADCHVRTACDEREVEVYGSADGQVRVKAPMSGVMDGKPIGNDHPVTAGAVLRFGKLSMVMQPWLPRD